MTVRYDETVVVVGLAGASGPGVRSIQKVVQWDIGFSCVGIVKQSDIHFCGMYSYIVLFVFYRIQHFSLQCPANWHIFIWRNICSA